MTIETKPEKIIMYGSHEAATYRTNIEGWVSADGIYCGKGYSPGRFRTTYSIKK